MRLKDSSKKVFTREISFRVRIRSSWIHQSFDVSPHNPLCVHEMKKIFHFWKYSISISPQRTKWQLVCSISSSSAACPAKNVCHLWSYCQWVTYWGPPPSTSCSSWSLSSCRWAGRRHLRKWVLFYLSTVASPESVEGKGGSAVAFPKHLSSHCGAKNIINAINHISIVFAI